MKLIIANWKSHKSWDEAQTWLQEFKPSAAQLQSETRVVVAPPMPLLGLLRRELDQMRTGLELGVQDLSAFPPGSYTGATSVKNIEGLGVSWAILGHSERRRYFHETYQEVANKVDQALTVGITPVVCVDEGDIAQQLAAIDDKLWSKCVIAYEPLAAIGSGHEEPLSEVERVVTRIRSQAKPLAVIYGGSVSASTISGYLGVCKGALVATHSLAASDFSAVVAAAT